MAMAVNPELLRSELEMFVNSGLDDNVLEKFQELCIQYQLDEVKIAEEWVAFSFNRNGLNPNVDTLERFEYEKLMKLGAKTNMRRRMEDVNSLHEIAEDDEGEELIDSYSTPAKGSQKRQLTTPEHPVSKRKVGQGRSPLLHCISPSIISPSATPSQKYSSRTNAGVVVASYGQPHSTQWQGCQGRTAQVERFTGGHDALLKPYKHMFQGLHDIREVLDQKIEDMGHFLKEAYNIEEFSSLTLPTQESVTVLGQICCDGNGKLNHQSLLLEGNVDISAGLTVPLNISDVNEYSLFPGQVVVMDGINTSGQTFVASKLYEGKPLPFYKPSSEELENTNCEAAMVLVGCGPYTTSDGICYDPLLDLIAVIKRDRPDVCLLLGPFVDISHEQVLTCQLKEIFMDLLKSCILRIIEETQSLTTQLVFVPSLRDSFHNFVYPLPPYTDLGIPAQDTQRVHFVAEPSTIIINGVVFGLSSTDVFFHMSSEEIATVQMASPDRFTRLLKHILTQHSYFPLYPPPEEVPVNYEHLQQFATFSVTPDILILPSKLRHFMKVRLLLISHGFNCQVDSVLASFSKRLAKEPSDPTGNLCSDKWRSNLWLAALHEAAGRPEEQCLLLAKLCFEKWLQVRLAHLKLLPETKEMLVRLRGDEGLRLGLLTNGEASTQRDKINACACSRFFDAVCVAAELGAEKPLPAAYLQCCQQLDVLPERTVMVGDSWECDISGSLTAGLRSAVWVNPDDQTPGPGMGGMQRWHSVHSVLEAEVLLKKML